MQLIHSNLIIVLNFPRWSDCKVIFDFGLQSGAKTSQNAKIEWLCMLIYSMLLLSLYIDYIPYHNNITLNTIIYKIYIYIHPTGEILYKYIILCPPTCIFLFIIYIACFRSRSLPAAVDISWYIQMSWYALNRI